MVTASAVAATIAREQARTRLAREHEDAALLLDLELVFALATVPALQPGAEGLTAMEVADRLGARRCLVDVWLALDRARRSGQMVADSWKADHMITRRWRAAR